MGYEIKLVIGQVSSGMEEDGANYMSIIATVDLCKIGEGHLSQLDSFAKADDRSEFNGNNFIQNLKKMTKQKMIDEAGTGQLAGELFLDDEIPLNEVYFFSPFGGDEKVVEDFYSKKTVAVPVNLVYECIKHDNESSPYRRYDAALGLLETFLDENKWGEISVVLFGH